LLQTQIRASQKRKELKKPDSCPREVSGKKNFEARRMPKRPRACLEEEEKHWEETLHALLQKRKAPVVHRRHVRIHTKPPADYTLKPKIALSLQQQTRIFQQTSYDQRTPMHLVPQYHCTWCQSILTFDDDVHVYICPRDGQRFYVCTAHEEPYGYDNHVDYRHTTPTVFVLQDYVQCLAPGQHLPEAEWQKLQQQWQLLCPEKTQKPSLTQIHSLCQMYATVPYKTWCFHVYGVWHTDETLSQQVRSEAVLQEVVRKYNVQRTANKKKNIESLWTWFKRQALLQLR
jgi:hypothetical protein